MRSVTARGWLCSFPWRGPHSQMTQIPKQDTVSFQQGPFLCASYTQQCHGRGHLANKAEPGTKPQNQILTFALQKIHGHKENSKTQKRKNCLCSSLSHSSTSSVQRHQPLLFLDILRLATHRHLLHHWWWQITSSLSSNPSARSFCNSSNFGGLFIAVRLKPTSSCLSFDK